MSASIIACLAAVSVLCLLVIDDAYAHAARGGFYSQEPDFALAIPMSAAAGFALFAIVVKRIRLVWGVGLIVGSLAGFVFTTSELARLGNEPASFLPPTQLYYEILGYTLVTAIIAVIGGIVLTSYYYFARRPYLKYKVTK